VAAISGEAGAPGPKRQSGTAGRWGGGAAAVAAIGDVTGPSLAGDNPTGGVGGATRGASL